MVIHLLTGQKATEYNTGCGITRTSKDGMPSDVSGWSSDITCPKCATRLFVTHSMTKIVDLDNPEIAKKFHFTGKSWGFRWLIGEQLIYIYETPDGPHAMCAVPISNFVPDTRTRGCTYQDAQAAAREWVIKHGDNRLPVNDAPTRHKARVKKAAPPPKPRIPEGYDGALCAKCGKIDEGDFVPSPDNMLEQVCMICLIQMK